MFRQIDTSVVTQNRGLYFFVCRCGHAYMYNCRMKLLYKIAKPLAQQRKTNNIEIAVSYLNEVM